MTPPGAIPRARNLLLPMAALLLCTVQIAATFPGELVYDSTEQLRQAMSHRFGDWHPPMMALVWSWLIGLTGSPGSLLVFQDALHWIGFGLLADGCSRAGMPKRAWAILLAGAFPLFLFYDRILVKDVEMASAFIAAVGICCWFLFVRRTIPWWATTIACLLLAYGTLVRTNAVFALGPLVCLSFVQGRRLALTKLIVFSAVVAMVAVPLSNTINHRWIGASQQDSLQSLQIYDLVGIEVRSGDVRVLGSAQVPIDALRNCYTSYWWDPFSLWGACKSLRPALKYVSDPPNSELVSERSALWRHAIMAHPVDYLAHRLNLFNSSVYFVVPALHFRFANAIVSPSKKIEGRISNHDIRMDYLNKNVLFWPVCWLVVGLCTLGFLDPTPSISTTGSIARLLIISGLMYAAAYFLFGVATDIRYYYWPIMAILVGVLLVSPDVRRHWGERRLRARLALLLLAMTILGGYAARLGNVHFV